KPLTGGYVPGRGAHQHVHYIFGLRDQQGYTRRCAHGTCGYMLLQRSLYELVRFRYGPHPIKRETWLSEDPCYAADAAFMGLAPDWYIDVRATADHIDDPDRPLVMNESVSGYKAES